MSPTWADLDDPSAELVRETERTLAVDVVLVYREAASGRGPNAIAQLEPAPLDESQMECLQGVEGRVGGVAVAYWRRSLSAS